MDYLLLLTAPPFKRTMAVSEVPAGITSRANNTLDILIDP
jgi:hypothetical protein